MIYDRDFNPSDAAFGKSQADDGTDAILLAQAETGSDPAGSPASDPASSTPVPGISIVIPDSGNRVTLRDSISIENLQLDGDDLLLIQPDGSQVRVIGGAVNIPTFVIGDLEIPQDVLVAAFTANGFNVAAGPGNTLSASAQTPTGSGGEFQDSSGASLEGDGLQVLGLLSDDSGTGDGAGGTFSELNAGNDRLEGGEGNDNPSGGAGDNILNGGSFNSVPVLVAGAAVTGEVSEADVIPVTEALTFASGLLNLSIPGTGSGGDDSDPVVSTIEVPAGGSVLDINVTLDMVHTYMGDLEVSLVTPDGTEVWLTYGDGWEGAEGEMTFDDEAASDFYSGEATGWVGTWTPSYDSLSKFDGKDMSGVWSLRIKDWFGGDTGTLRSWSLEISTGDGGTPIATSSAEVDLTSLVNVGAEVTSNGGSEFTLKTIATAEDLTGVTKGGVQVQIVSDGTTLTGFAEGAPDTPLFTLTISGAGIATVTLLRGLDQADDTGQIDFSRFIEASDASGDSVTLADGQFVITVNDTVPVPAADTFSGDEDATISGNVALNDAAGADGGAAGGGYAIVTGPAHGVITAFNAASGDFTYNPTANYNGADGFTYTLTDGDGDVSDPATVSLTVNSVNDAPAIAAYQSGQGYVEVAGDSSAQDIAAVHGWIRVIDVDVGDTLTGEIVGTPTITWSGGELPAAQAAALAQALAEGKLTFDSSVQSSGGDVLIEWTYDPSATDFDFLAYGENLYVTFPMRVSDGSVTSQTVNFYASIAGSNDAPVVSSPVTLATIAENSGARIITQAELMANASDLDVNNETVATNLTITTGNGMLDDNGDGTWSYTPAPNDNSDVSFSYDVSDVIRFPTTVSTSATLDITVHYQTAVEDLDFVSSVATGAYADTGALAAVNPFTLVTGPINGALQFNAQTGAYTYTPAENYSGADSFTYTVSHRDGTVGASTTAGFDVTPVADGAVITVPVIYPVPSGGNSVVNTDVSSNPRDPSVAAIDGGYVVTWSSYGQDGSDSGVYAQRYSSDGTRQGDETQVNTYVTFSQNFPSVAAIDGGYVVTWSSFGQDGSGYGVYAQRYLSDGTRQGHETQVNTYVTGNQYDSSVAAIDGGYIVTWTSQKNQDGSGFGVYSQRYLSDGTRQGHETQVNTYVTDTQYDSSVAAIDGGYIVTWTSLNQDGSGYGVVRRHIKWDIRAA